MDKPAVPSALPRRIHAEMLDSFGEGFIAFDATWRITHCNRLGAAHYNLAPENLIGRIAWTVPGMASNPSSCVG